MRSYDFDISPHSRTDMVWSCFDDVHNLRALHEDSEEHLVFGFSEKFLWLMVANGSGGYGDSHSYADISGPNFLS